MNDIDYDQIRKITYEELIKRIGPDTISWGDIGKILDDVKTVPELPYVIPEKVLDKFYELPEGITSDLKKLIDNSHINKLFHFVDDNLSLEKITSDFEKYVLYKNSKEVISAQNQINAADFSKYLVDSKDAVKRIINLGNTFTGSNSDFLLNVVEDELRKVFSFLGKFGDDALIPFNEHISFDIKEVSIKLTDLANSIETGGAKSKNGFDKKAWDIAVPIILAILSTLTSVVNNLGYTLPISNDFGVSVGASVGVTASVSASTTLINIGTLLSSLILGSIFQILTDALTATDTIVSRTHSDSQQQLLSDKMDRLMSTIEKSTS